MSAPPLINPVSCAPILRGIQAIRSWLERDGIGRLMIASPNLQTFREQQFHAPVDVHAKKRIGPRINDARGRLYRNTKLILARWPRDEQVAYAAASLFCVVSGQPQVHIADYSVACHPGDILFFPAGVPQPTDVTAGKKKRSDNDPAQILWMSPRMSAGDGMECSINHWFGEVRIPGETRDGEWCWIRNRTIASQFEYLGEELENDNTREIAFHLLQGMLLMLEREIIQMRVYIPHPMHSRTADSLSPAGSNSIEDACAHIRANIRYPLTIDGVARKVYMSPANLTRKFRQQTGKTFKEYLTELRLKEAVALLQNTKWSVDRVARFVGLRSSRLRELFHIHYGCSPQQFRQCEQTKKSPQ